MKDIFKTHTYIKLYNFPYSRDKQDAQMGIDIIQTDITQL